MEETRTEFIAAVTEEFNNYCRARGEEPTNERFAAYMINRNLVTDKTIKRFVIINQYPHLVAENGGSKKFAIYDLEDKTGHSFSHIRSIIAHYLNDFRLQKRVITINKQA